MAERKEAFKRKKEENKELRMVKRLQLKDYVSCKISK
jgi:hypothetical protein